jgi:hypothetical protein
VLITGVSALAASISVQAADYGVGNGGGAWVCRDASKKIIWSKLVDRFEMEREFKWSVDEAFYTDPTSLALQPLSSREIMQKIVGKLTMLDKNFATRFESVVKYLGRQANNYLNADLAVINDSLFRIMPRQSECLSGTIRYEQIANYTADDRLLINPEIYNSLDSIDGAGLWVHEALYYIYRSDFKDTDSIRARKITGVLLSGRSLTSYVADFPGIQAADFSRYFSIQPQFLKMGALKEGYATFKTSQSNGIIDLQAHFKLVGRYDSILDVSEGLAFGKTRETILNEGSYSVIDVTKDQILYDLPSGYYPVNGFRNGYARIGSNFPSTPLPSPNPSPRPILLPQDPPGNSMSSNQKMGLIDRSGAWVVPPIFYSLTNVHDNTIGVCPDYTSQMVAGCWFQDLKGNKLSNERYLAVEDMINGKAIVTLANRNKAVVNRDGSIRFELKNKGMATTLFRGDLGLKRDRFVSTHYYLSGSITSSDSHLLDNQGNILYSISGGLISVFGTNAIQVFDRTNNSSYLLRDDGSELMKFNSNHLVLDPKTQLVIANDPKTNLYGIMSLQGQWVSDFRFESFKDGEEGHYPVSYRGQWGILDLNRVKANP